MAESRDSAIKLFGKTIPLRPSGCSGKEEKKFQDHKEEDHESPAKEEKSDPPTTTARETAKPSSTNQEDTAMKDSKPIQQSNETSNFQEKAPKKPEKILPCPRCNSLDTKFCYFNNYNVNQPRYYCKKCQRYWTAGGVVRNVPVGAGRRKNKNSISYYRHITMSDATLQAVRSDVMKAICQSPLKPNGTVLSFRSDMPFRESMASVQSPEKTVKSCTRNGCHKMEEKMVPLSCRREKGDEQSNSEQELAKTNLQGVPATITCLNGKTPTPSSTTGFAIPFYPTTAYWGCEVPGSWIIPWLSSPLASSPNNSGSPGAGPNSPTLGKHSRNGNAFKSSNVDQR